MGEAFKKWPIFKNHVWFFDGIFKGWGLSGVKKKSKSAKLRGVMPVLHYYEDVVAILRMGCGVFGEVKTEIFDRG